MEMIILFVVLQLVNVVLQTLKSIITVKGTTTQSALMNAIAYGVYTVIVVFTASDKFSLIDKVLITMGTNLIGVYISAWILSKFKKDKLWKIESTISWDYVPNIPYNDQKNKFLNDLIDKINAQKLSYHYIELPKREFLFSFYCKTQKESLALKEILKDYNAKYIVHEETVKL